MVLMATFRIELSSTTISRLSIRTPRIAQRRRCTASGIREAGTAGVVMRTSLGEFQYGTVSYLNSFAESLHGRTGAEHRPSTGRAGAERTAMGSHGGPL